MCEPITTLVWFGFTLSSWLSWNSPCGNPPASSPECWQNTVGKHGEFTNDLDSIQRQIAADLGEVRFGAFTHTQNDSYDGDNEDKR